MYWLNEGVEGESPRDSELIRYTSDLVHAASQRFYWIPFFQGNRSFDWKNLGFDAAVLQPNHFFAGTTEIRIEDTAGLAKEWGMGVEMECDVRMFTDPNLRQRYIDYLNGAVKYGYANAFRAYYQALLQASRSTDPAVRQLYDWTYQSIKGTYQIQ